MRSSIATMLAGLLPLAASIRVPAKLQSGDAALALDTVAAATASCMYPAAFDIFMFRRWMPLVGNDHAIVVDFGFVDNTTQLLTACHLNGRSPNVGVPGLAPRFACDDPTVEFILQNDTLTVVEKVCPGSKLEVAGAVTLNMTCVATDSNSTYGAGTDCFSNSPIVRDPFDSLNPTPQNETRGGSGGPSSTGRD